MRKICKNKMLSNFLQLFWNIFAAISAVLRKISNGGLIIMVYPPLIPQDVVLIDGQLVVVMPQPNVWPTLYMLAFWVGVCIFVSIGEGLENLWKTPDIAAAPLSDGLTPISIVEEVMIGKWTRMYYPLLYGKEASIKKSSVLLDAANIPYDSASFLGLFPEMVMSNMLMATKVCLLVIPSIIFFKIDALPQIVIFKLYQKISIMQHNRYFLQKNNGIQYYLRKPIDNLRELTPRVLYKYQRNAAHNFKRPRHIIDD